jgi:ferredoxin
MSAEGKKRRELLKTLIHLTVKPPEKPVMVPEGVQGFGMIVKKENKTGNCLACQKCVTSCEDDAIHLQGVFDLSAFLRLSAEQIENVPLKKKKFYHVLKSLSLKESEDLVEIPEDMTSFGEIKVVASNCIACMKCVEICPEQLLEKLDLFDLPAIFSELNQLS